MSKAAGWKKIYWGYYEISTKGVIRRVKEGKGTWIGRVLKPYHTSYSGNSDEGYVCLYVKGKRYQKSVNELVVRAFS
jgi:hypothetical protein